MRTFLLILGIWTVLEGGLTLCFPHLAIRMAGGISKAIRAYLAQQTLQDIRKLGAIECIFGLGVLALFQFGP
jgi:uncharacterized protein YjeT (DUF2065 family)